MNKKSILVSLFTCFLLLTVFAPSVWALKNVCPACRTLIEDLELTKCPKCEYVLNKCLNCGLENPVKNDHCAKCNSNMAESRVLKTIDESVRENLKLGKSPRAVAERELGQIEVSLQTNPLTPEVALRRLELLMQMGWWIRVDSFGSEFSASFAGNSNEPQVKEWRAKALRHLGYCALQDNNKEQAIKFLNDSLAIVPGNKETTYLLKKAKK